MKKTQKFKICKFAKKQKKIKINKIEKNYCIPRANVILLKSSVSYDTRNYLDP